MPKWRSIIAGYLEPHGVSPKSVEAGDRLKQKTAKLARKEVEDGIRETLLDDYGFGKAVVTDDFVAALAATQAGPMLEGKQEIPAECPELSDAMRMGLKAEDLWSIENPGEVIKAALGKVPTFQAHKSPNLAGQSHTEFPQGGSSERTGERPEWGQLESRVRERLASRGMTEEKYKAFLNTRKV